jgi:hypothetical protein
MDPEMSAIAHARAFTEEARTAASAANELGAAFDLRVVGKILEDDARVHEQIVTKGASIADGIKAVLADGVVTDDEEKILETLQRQAATITNLARV